MSKIELPEFKSYEEEAAFWDNLDTGDFMEDDGEWLHFDVADECVQTSNQECRGGGKGEGEDGFADDRIPSPGCNPSGAKSAYSDTAALKGDDRCYGV
ncbi:MAG: hypothetical protein NT169_08345 [Chloroflexi bacterium]|nr:hypothetical protein [Chloroflexota bacterium]